VTPSEIPPGNERQQQTVPLLATEPLLKTDEKEDKVHFSVDLLLSSFRQRFCELHH
jgi:hypothetical protein